MKLDKNPRNSPRLPKLIWVGWVYPGRRGTGIVMDSHPGELSIHFKSLGCYELVKPKLSKKGKK